MSYLKTLSSSQLPRRREWKTNEKHSHI